MQDEPKPLVLVAEDEHIIRFGIVDEFEEAGFSVLEASNADEASALLNTNPAVRALFTDVDMPGTMDGIALARLVARERPDIRIVIASGKIAPQEAELPQGAVFFSKPYDLGRVIRHMSAAMGS